MVAAVHISSLSARPFPLSQSVGAKLDKLVARCLKAVGPRRKEEEGGAGGFLDGRRPCQTIHHRLIHDDTKEAA